MNMAKSSDQRGIVSLMVTLIMMLVISLIVIGFSQVARTNQREALDRQLSTQAYYAAETGINDAVKAIDANPTTYATTTSYTTNCSSLIGALGSKNVLNTAANVKYTCLLLNSKPTSINYTSVANQHAVAVPLNVQGNLTQLTFSWNASTNSGFDAGQCGSSLTALPSATNWHCSYALLHVDLVQLGGAVDAASLSNNTLSFYLRPFGSAGAVPGVTSFTAGAPGSQRVSYVQSGCTLSGVCTAVLNFSGAASGTNYGLRLSSIYQDAKNVHITGKVVGGQAATFSGAQISVDSTGQAQDQLRRIQVRLPVQSADIPANALESGADICKLLSVNTDSIVDNCTGTTYPLAAAPSNGESIIDPGTCGSGNLPSCGTAPSGGGYHYEKQFTNDSNNDPANVTGCTWDWGDGTPVQSYGPNDSIDGGATKVCQFGGLSPLHTYAKLSPEPAYPIACWNNVGGPVGNTSYTATLTINLSNTSPKSDTRAFSMPDCY